MDPLTTGLHIASLIIGFVGASVILWGVLLGLVQLVRAEALSLLGRDATQIRDALRHRLAYYLLLSLEFLIAADVIETIIQPTLKDLAILGAIIAIRTVISFSLNWELLQTHKKKVE